MSDRTFTVTVSLPPADAPDWVRRSWVVFEAQKVQREIVRRVGEATQ